MQHMTNPYRRCPTCGIIKRAIVFCASNWRPGKLGGSCRKCRGLNEPEIIGTARNRVRLLRMATGEVLPDGVRIGGQGLETSTAGNGGGESAYRGAIEGGR